jgi:hypothetical protein
MPKLTVITDTQGTVLGTVRSDPIQLEEAEESIQFTPVQSDEYRYHEIEVSDDLMQGSPEQIHAEVASRLGG